MLCEKCTKRHCDSRNEALALSVKLGIVGRHVSGGKWFPGDSPKILEDWCAKNCKPAKAKVITPVTEKVKMVGSNKDWLKKDKKKD